MDNRQIRIKLIYDYLGLKFKMDSFQDRLVLQKAIYLVQVSGFNLGYHFSWYRRGPYGTSLASDGFSIQDEIATGCDESENWKLHESCLAKLENIQDWFSEKEDTSKLADKLELLASVHFLVVRKGMDQNNTTQLKNTLEDHGKYFLLDKIRWAVKELSGREFFN